MKLTLHNSGQIQNVNDRSIIQNQVIFRNFVTARYQEMLKLYEQVQIRWIRVSFSNFKFALINKANEIVQLSGANEQLFILPDASGQIDDVNHETLDFSHMKNAIGVRKLYSNQRGKLTFLYRMPKFHRGGIKMPDFMSQVDVSKISLRDSLETLIGVKMSYLPHWIYYGVHNWMFDSQPNKPKFQVDLDYSMGITLRGFKYLKPETRILPDGSVEVTQVEDYDRLNNNNDDDDDRSSISSTDSTFDYGTQNIEDVSDYDSDCSEYSTQSNHSDSVSPVKRAVRVEK